LEAARPSVAVARQKNERVHVPWSHGPEMAMVQGGELWLAEALHDRDYGSIDEAEREVVVLLHHGSRTGEVAGDELSHAEPSLDDIGEKGIEGRRPEAAGRKPLELHDDRRRNDERLLGRFEKGRTTGMIFVVAIHGRIERPGVYDERQGGGS
jgi:hypothetical protein